MKELVIPPNPNWFVPSSCFCTQDGGFIYGASTKICLLTPNQDPGLKFLDIRKKLMCFAISPEWSETKQLAVMNGDMDVVIYNFATGKGIKGHKGHGNETNRQSAFTSILYTSSTSILSSFNSEIIQYCLRTNRFNVYPDFTSRNAITTMKMAPNNSTIVAIGTKNGLILLVDSEKMTIMSRLRGHDAEITCLDFITISEKKKPPPPPPAAADDMFDIYSYESVENEFGVYQEAADDNSDDNCDVEFQEKVPNSSNFDFLEACSNLKETILSSKDENADLNATTSSEGKFADNCDQYGLENTKDPSPDLSMASNPSSHTPVLTEESLNFLEERQRMNDFVVVPKKEKEFLILASGSRESVVWLWNVNEKKPLHKVKWHPKAKSSLPAIFTNVLWQNQDTLLATDNNGDIIEYKIRFDMKIKSVKAEKTNKSFDGRGVISLCKTADNTCLWMSSIHRNITCLEVETNTKKISLDTMQTRVHCIIENPIDSHVIAVGGNDKRLCIWNTSDASPSMISLKPFMNKIQTSILALAWHPQKDNLIAFGTREGRIAVLDTTRFTNVPIILKSFSSHEIYSLTWAKLGEAIILLACSGGKVVYYSQKDYELHHLNQFAQINSISTCEKRMVLGSSVGDLLICELSEDFKVLARRNVCKKYVGMISWHGQNQVAVGSETGVLLIKDVDKFIATDQHSNEIATTLSNRRGRVYSVRFNKQGTLLVSCCMHGNIDVWSLSEGEEKLVATMNIESPAYSAIFMPNSENIILCGGQDSTVCTFEWEKYPPQPSAAAPSARSEVLERFKDIEWAKILELTTTSRHSNRRVKKKVKENAKNGNLEIKEVTKALSAKLNLNSSGDTGCGGSKKSLFTTANKELISNSLGLLEAILSDEMNQQLTFEKLMMMGDRDDVQKALDNEFKEMPKVSIERVILPQLTDDLKKDILERIASKSLMDIHVALAPAVSYDLWRKCCLAYGEQLIENDEFILAMPYLLAINDVDKCIQKLCESRNYREAWVVAKLRKERDDPIFEKIMQEWLRMLELRGNFEPAAALLCMRKEYKRAHEMLSKRQNMIPKCAEILELLSTKLSEETAAAEI